MRKKLLVLIVFIMIVSISLISNAGIEVKNGTTPYVNINISQAFDACYNLRDGTSTLGANSLDPHMATALDWGAVAYLAQSRYGANASSLSNNTTGNESGVMQLGRDSTLTATMYESRNKTSGAAKSYRYRLEEALADDNLKKYVDIIPNAFDVESTRGRAVVETKNWYGALCTVGNAIDLPIMMREYSAFGFSIGYSYGDSGQAHNLISFRPVIWN